ncbi:hypothetical protein RA19_20865 [Leisingera sp. ANG-M1]|uniref:calcium-binding protein n=1 Tax=Leisingera sp. ANG-M1 TaxID=1577895 RepID=UPI00057F69FF|nr:calcium-binding protein [Leisingera sp. ANG-M1]KIC08417.1 hypothetical protein RA19_20865 [Leisingera sp. ANG-M1]
MNGLIFLGIGLTIGLAALFLDDDDSSSTSGEPTDGDDILTGTEGDDEIFAGDGEDLIEGRGGNDRLFGEEDNDFVSGGAGDDFLRGGEGDDYVLDHEGSDTLEGNLGDDTIVATSALDGEEIAAFAKGVFNGTISDPSSIEDLYRPDTDTDSDADRIRGGEGDDLVLAGDGDVVSLGEGEDTLGVGDWIVAGDEPVVLTDYSRFEDAIVYSHDGQGNAPELSLEETLDAFGDPEDALLYADGHLVARIEGAGGLVSLNDIRIVDRSSLSDPVLSIL